ncbi:MAG TPA: pyrimidine dimer DNA glycosylase/endonuclease V [Thermoanaerobaculia bacterium]|nr:pyrimidine dimer DNA glycosylase/endonuclease V [Thermoanaerobaculia bacterium]
MRLWSLHPRYLDAAGLVALWREGLLAQAVLAGKTRGYTRHPQLTRFREQEDPCASIAAYLHRVAEEAERRGYKFDRAKLPEEMDCAPIEVTDAQLRFEWRHLKAKLRMRDPARLRELARERAPDAHPVFVVVSGAIASWEKGESR